MAEFAWYRHWPDNVPKHVEIPDEPLPALLTKTARAHPDATATTFLRGEMTYGELDRKASAFAAHLARLGVKPGDRVGLVLPNFPGYLVAFFGALRAGAVVVNTNPLYTPRELDVQFRDAGVETVIVADIFLKNTLAVRQALGLQRVVVADMKPWMGFPVSLLYPIVRKRRYGKIEVPEAPWLHRLEALLEGGAPPTVRVDPAEDVAVFQYTGGTTGTPKGAMLTHRNLWANTMQAAAWLPNAKPAGEVFASVIPFFHVYGLTTALLAPILLASTLAIHPDPRDIKATVKLLTKQRVTIFPGVPAQFTAIVNLPNARKVDLRSITACISGSAPLPQDVRRRFEQLTGGKLVEGYGLTEASPVTHANPLYGKVKECIGIPFPSTEARVVDAERGETIMDVGEAGEMIIRGPQVMKGYWRKPEETAQVLRGQWLYTGDIAKMDEDGYFHILDRKKDIIITSGFNVYPTEVEEVLFAHPAVLEAAVVGAPDERRGEIVKAYVVRNPTEMVTAEDLQRYCRERLAPFKVPRAIEFRKELPKTVVGKVLRRALRG